MRRRQQFLGRYLPGDGWLHRTPAGAKFAGLAALSLVVLLARSPWVSLASLGLVLLLGTSARIPLRELVSPVRRVWLIVAFIVVFHLVFSDPVTALRVVSTILACVLAAGLLMLTTPVAVLLAVFAALARPLRLLGVDPDRVALTAALMVRSLPYLADLTAVTGDSARARGLERNLRARTVPVLLGAVKYATDTGRALDARGLGDPDHGPERP